MRGELISLLGINLIVLSGCNYTISMVHTEGQATDVIDATSSADAKVDPNINIPLTP